MLNIGEGCSNSEPDHGYPSAVSINESGKSLPVWGSLGCELYLHSGSSDAFGETRAVPEGEIPQRIIGVGDRITDLGCTIDRLAQRLHDAGVMCTRCHIPDEGKEKQPEDLTQMGAEIRKQSVELGRLNYRLNNLLLSLEL